MFVGKDFHLHLRTVQVSLSLEMTIKKQSPEFRGLFALHRFCQTEFILAYAVVTVLLHHLVDQVFGDDHECERILNADLADGIAGYVRMEGDRADNVIRSDAA